MVTARAREVLEKYGSDKYPPVLDETMQLAVRQLLQEGGMELCFGILPLPESDETHTTNTLLSYDLGSKRILDLNPRAVIGPYVLAGEYYREGIGVWVPVQPEQPRAKEG
jgi:hypothetical protein